MPKIGAPRKSRFSAVVIVPASPNLPSALVPHWDNGHLARCGRAGARPSRMESRHLGGSLGQKFVPHIFATMSRMLDLSIDEKAKHFLPRWFSDAPTWMSTALSSVRAMRTNFFICSNASYICPS